MIYSPNSESRIRAHIAHLELQQKIEQGERTKELFDQLDYYVNGEQPSLARRLWRRLLGR